jgi:hypothetical protein
MVYNTQDYWIFGLGPSSRILKDAKEHNILGTGSVSYLRWEIPIRILEIESNCRYRNYKKSAHVARLTNPISKPGLYISPICIPFINNEVINSQVKSV